MFEAYTYEAIMADAIARAPDGIDTRQGSIYYDAISGVCLRIAKYYTDLDLIREMSTLLTATGEALDDKAAEHGIVRRTATPAQYKAEFEGTIPKDGERFYYDMAYFVLKTVDDQHQNVRLFQAEKPGEDGNDIYPGTPAVPVNTIPGLTAATFGDIYLRGTDDEDDNSLRSRTLETISGAAENGNKQHYKIWSESRTGVGRARIYPLWQGENTVKAVLIDPTGKPCSPSVVQDVQKYIDPADKGMTYDIDGKKYVKGDGLGNGVANIGAHFTAVAANPLEISVAFKAEIKSGYSSSQVQQEAKEAIQQYFKEIVLSSDDGTESVVRVSAVGAIISGVKSLTDYSDLKLNGEDVNITPESEDVPVLKEVIVT